MARSVSRFESRHCRHRSIKVARDLHHTQRLFSCHFLRSSHENSWLVSSWFPGIPRQFREKQAHAAPVGDAREDKARADEGRNADEVGVNKDGEQDTCDYERSGSDADLAFEADDLRRASIDREPSIDPSQRTSFDDDGVI